MNGYTIKTNKKAIEKIMNADFKTEYSVTDYNARQAQRACRCISCGLVHKAEDSYLFLIPKNNTVGVCLCNDCRGLGNLKPYATKNDTIIGKQTKGTYAGITTSFELETYGYSSTARATLTNAGFVCCRDSSLRKGYEGKSPITNNAHSFGLLSSTIQWLVTNPNIDFKLDTRDTGAHIHYGLSTNEFDYTRVDKRVFDAYVEFFDALPREKRIAFFGRDFNDYCNNRVSIITRGFDYDKYVSVNMCHANTVEFRTIKFIDNKQFMRAYYAHRDVFAIALDFWRGYISLDNAQASIKAQLQLWIDTI